MKLLQTLAWVSAGVAGLGLLGCDRDEKMRRSPQRSVRRPPPTPVYEAQRQPQYVIVRKAPPAVIRERRPSPPSGGHMWVAGYWHWDGRQYVWQVGHWTRPPREHVTWVAPRYEKHERGYRYSPGLWRDEQKERPRRPSEDAHRDRR